MKRIELFEFEDHPRFLSWLRDAMTAHLEAFHRAFRTAPAVADLVRKALASSEARRVVDLCSGGGAAASNARTYTPDDVRELLSGHEDAGYSWEIGVLCAGRLPAKSVYVLGRPVAS